MTLAEFLLARIAEDEASVRANQAYTVESDGSLTPDGRPLAECEAKRRIAQTFYLYQAYANGEPEGSVKHELMRDRSLTLWDVLRTLALPYADHPDYQQQWRPS